VYQASDDERSVVKTKRDETRMDMALDCKGDSEGKGDGKEDRVADLKGGIGHISSPRKRLEQVRRQAKAIDEEVSKGVREC
jgi:hypothetical protein